MTSTELCQSDNLDTSAIFKWDDGNDYAPTVARRHYSQRLVDWVALCDVARKHRGVNCDLDTRVKFGGVHMVVLLTFEDGQQWIARVRMPRLSMTPDGSVQICEPWTEIDQQWMKSEIDTMRYLREHSNIPIPELFVFDVTEQNAVGAPYTMMQCIYGNSITDLSGKFDVPDEHKDKVRAAMAKFQVVKCLEVALGLILLVYSVQYRISADWMHCPEP